MSDRFFASYDASILRPFDARIKFYIQFNKNEGKFIPSCNLTRVTLVIHDSYLCTALHNSAMQIRELEFNSDYKCISNTDVDCSGYNDIIDLGSRRRLLCGYRRIFGSRSPELSLSLFLSLAIREASATSTRIQNKSP